MTYDGKVGWGQFINPGQPCLTFHKSCADGLFGAYLFLAGLRKRDIEPSTGYRAVPLSPHLIPDRLSRFPWLARDTQAIIDLPLFTTGTKWWFDHHATNKNTPIGEDKIQGMYDHTAPSTCAILQRYFNLDTPEQEQLVKVANCYDQALHPCPVPTLPEPKVESFEELVWATNDLLKGTPTEQGTLNLWETFDPLNLSRWLEQSQNQVTIRRYRLKRGEALRILGRVDKGPVMFVINAGKQVQSEAWHLSLACADPDYKLLVVGQKITSGDARTARYRWSFRQNPRLSKELRSTYRVDMIAESLQGGGHQGVGSASTIGLEQAKTRIETWLTSLPEEARLTILNV